MLPESSRGPHGAPIYATATAAFPLGPWQLLEYKLGAYGRLMDSSPVFYGRKWWIFTSRKRRGGADLLLFSADDLLDDWAPHPANPITSDARYARCGGRPFVHEGRPYRCDVK